MKEITRKTIEIFQLDDGACPFVSRIESLDSKIRYRIKARLARVALGNFGDHKSLGEGLNELRFSFGSGYRIYYTEVDDVIVLLFSGGDKGSQKKDIKQAKDYMKKYIGDNHG